MKVIDISIEVNENMPVWPGDDRPKYTLLREIGDESPCTVHAYFAGLHTGTHIDAPNHFIKGGKKLNEMDLELLIGRCYVIECKCPTGKIEKEELEGRIPDDIIRLLIKTPNSKNGYNREFNYEFCGLSEDAAKYLADTGIKVVGVDYLSIGPYGVESTPSHRAFLKNNDAFAIEGIYLNDVDEGEYELYCLPVKLSDVEGAPARAILIDRR